MPFSATPTFNRFAGRLGWRRTYDEVSVRSWTISPGVTRTEVPCLHDPADLERVTGYGFASSAQIEEGRVQGRRIEHGATRAYLLRNVTLLDGHLFRPGMTMQLADGPVPWASREPLQQREHAVLASTHFGFKYFGHWVCDDLPLRMAAREFGNPVTWDRPTTEHQRTYAHHLDLDVEALGQTRFRELVVIDDRGQNTYKRERWDEIRRRMGSTARSATHEGVMYLRGTSGEKRLLRNELEVAEALRRRGFRIADPTRQTAEEMMAVGCGARVVVGVEGSQNAHGLLAIGEGGTMIALQPPNRFNNVYKDRCDCLGLRYGFIVGHPAEDGSFTIDIDALCRLLDRVTPQVAAYA